MIHRARYNVEPLLRKKEGTRYKLKKSKNEYLHYKSIEVCMSFLVHAIKTRIKNCRHVLILISYRYLRLRAVAYCWLVSWLCGYLGWDHLRPLLVCIYHRIRSEFPSINASICREHAKLFHAMLVTTYFALIIFLLIAKSVRTTAAQLQVT